MQFHEEYEPPKEFQLAQPPKEGEPVGPPSDMEPQTVDLSEVSDIGHQAVRKIWVVTEGGATEPIEIGSGAGHGTQSRDTVASEAPTFTKHEVTSEADNNPVEDNTIALNGLRLGVSGRLRKKESTSELQTEKHALVQDIPTRREELFTRVIKNQGLGQQTVHRNPIKGGRPIVKKGPRASTNKEKRELDKVTRRNNKAFKAAAERHRNASTYGRTPGTRTPFFERDTMPTGFAARDGIKGRSSQEGARSNSDARMSDIGTPEQLERFDERDKFGERMYLPSEIKSERKARKRYLAAAEKHEMLNESNLRHMRDEDNLKSKMARIPKRLSIYWRSRRKL